MATTPAPPAPRRPILHYLELLIAAAAIAVAVWATVSSWGGIVHGHPAYVVVLALTVIGAIVAAFITGLPRARPRRKPRTVLRSIVLAAGIAGLAIVAWLAPHSAVEPALAAMQSDASVTVTETSTEIVFTPTGDADGTGVFFQPGALVDARAYDAVLRPLAADGHTVVITKQPLGIAFLAVGALDAARAAHPEITGWVVGGHSLGGTVAAIEADNADDNADDAAVAPAVGLLLFASYPANDISASLTAPVASISGSNDGLSTPAKIEASAANLPADTEFTTIDGAVHAQFGAYGSQAGDGVATISAESALRQIVAASRAFVAGLA